MRITNVLILVFDLTKTDSIICSKTCSLFAHDFNALRVWSRLSVWLMFCWISLKYFQNWNKKIKLFSYVSPKSLIAKMQKTFFSSFRASIGNNCTEFSTNFEFSLTFSLLWECFWMTDSFPNVLLNANQCRNQLNVRFVRFHCVRTHSIEVKNWIIFYRKHISIVIMLGKQSKELLSVV